MDIKLYLQPKTQQVMSTHKKVPKILSKTKRPRLKYKPNEKKTVITKKHTYNMKKDDL